MRDGDARPSVGPQVVFSTDSTGRCTLSTGPGLRLLGLRPGELVGRDLFEVYGDDPAAVSALRRVLAGEQVDVEREFGGRVLAVSFQPVLDVSGAITGALGVSTDVTELRRAESEVQAARERAALLSDLSGRFTNEVLDPDRLLAEAARAVTEALGEHGSVRLHRAGGGVDELQAVWPPGSGPARAADEVLRVPLRSRGAELGVLEVARGPGRGPFDEEERRLAVDIADRCAPALHNALLLGEQRRANEELVRFRALADASVDLIAIADEGNGFVYVNPTLERSGIALDTDDIWRSLATHAGDDLATEVRRGVEESGQWSGDVNLQLDGRALVVRVDVLRLRHPETDAPMGTAWIGRDVTEIRSIDAALREANTDLKQFKALVEASPDFIAIADLDGSVRYVNPGGRTMIGLAPDLDVTTTSIPDYLTPEGLRASVEVEQPAVVAHGHWEGESTLRSYRGPAIPVAIASFLMRDVETGEPFALATVQRDISERLAAEQALRDLAAQREALLTRLVDAQDAERADIAADVHDDPVQALAVVDLRLGQLRRRLADRAPDLVDAVEALHLAVSSANERLRSLLFDLEPPDLAGGLGEALCRAAEEVFDNSGISWAVRAGDEPDVPMPTRAIAYRVAKEALINARKHSGARHVEVHLGVRGDDLEVSVVDDGVGLEGHPEPPQRAGHRGVATMRDRAALAGGECTVRTRSGGGTEVLVRLPGAAAR